MHNKYFKDVLISILVAFLVLLAVPTIVVPAFADSVQKTMILPITVIHDGDTIETDLTWRLPTPLNKVSIRIRGIDTPELPAESYTVTGKLNRAKCIKEAELALKARDRVRQIAKDKTTMRITNFDWDKYGGRIDADVEINGVDIGKTLLAENLARPYTGEGPKSDWCSP